MSNCNYCIISKNYLDKIFKTDLWYRQSLWDTNKLLFQLVLKEIKLSDVCCRTFDISKSEWKRKLREHAIDFGRNGDMETIAEDKIITGEGYYEVKFGKNKSLAIVVPEPWYSALQLRFAALWDKTILRKIYLM